MADNAWITTAGESKIVNALSTTSPFNITKWKVGDTENVPFNQALTDVVGTVVDNGTVTELLFNLPNPDEVIITVVLSEAQGPYDVGNVGLFSDDDTLIAIGTFETARTKIANAVGSVGNRLNLRVPIKFVDVQDAINFTILSTSTASWPSVEAIADLPDANLSSFTGYIVNNDPSQNRPVTAIRNEEPNGSGNYVWTIDYHNKIAGDSNADTDTIEIDTSTGEQLFRVGGESQLSITDGTLQLINNSVLGLNSTVDSNLKLTFGGDLDTGLGHPLANEVSIITNGSEAIRVDNLQRVGINTGDPDGTLHIFKGSSGASADGNASELVIEDDSNAGMSILSSASGFGIIYFGDSGDNNRGGILYDHGDDELRFRVSAIDRVQITDSALQLLNGTTFQFDNGTEGSPSVTAASDPDSGIYFSGSNSLGFSTNGSTRMSIADARVDILSGADLLVGINDTGNHSLITDQGTIELTNSANPFIDFKSSSAEDFDARIIYDVGANDFHYDIITGGQHKLRVNSINRFTVDAARTISDTTTEHLYQINSINKAIINTSGLSVLGTTSTSTGFKANDGTNSEVAYGFTADAQNDTGMYRNPNVTAAAPGVETGVTLVADGLETFSGGPTRTTVRGTTALTLTAPNIALGSFGVNISYPSGSIKAGDLSTALQTGSVGAENAGVVFTGGEYCFSPAVRKGGVGSYYNIARAQAEDGAGDNAMAVFAADADFNIALDFKVRYMLSSPPYQVGGIDYPFFAYVLRNKNTKEIISTSFSIDPSWAYNGPTDIRADEYDVINNKSYKERVYVKDGSVVRERVEIDYAFKNSDMNIVPHPFQNVKEDQEVILVGPTDKMMKDLYDLHEAGEDLPKVFREGNIVFGSQMELSETPSGVIICEAKWKNS